MYKIDIASSQQYLKKWVFLFLGIFYTNIYIHIFLTLKNIYNIYFLFIFGCAGSSLLCGLLSSCSEQDLLSSCRVQASHCRWLLIAEHGLWSTWTSVVVGHGPGSCHSQALEHRLDSCGSGLRAPHVGSSQIRDWTHVSWVGQQILYHRATREALKTYIKKLKKPY